MQPAQQQQAPNGMRIVFTHTSYNVWKKIIFLFLLLAGPLIFYLISEAVAVDVPSIKDFIFVVRSIFLVVIPLSYGLIFCGLAKQQGIQQTLGFTHDDLRQLGKIIAIPFFIAAVTLVLWTFGDGDTLTVVMADDNVPAVIVPLLILCVFCCCASTCVFVDKQYLAGCAGCYTTILLATFLTLFASRLGSVSGGGSGLSAYSWLSVFFTTFLIDLLLVPFFVAKCWQAWPKRNLMPEDTAKCACLQIGTTMWLGWTIMRLMLIVDDEIHSDSWTVFNTGNSAANFNQLADWQITMGRKDGNFIGCVDANKFPAPDSSTLSISSIRKLYIPDYENLGERSSIGICAANCVTFPYFSLARSVPTRELNQIGASSLKITCNCMSYNFYNSSRDSDTIQQNANAQLPGSECIGAIGSISEALWSGVLQYSSSSSSSSSGSSGSSPSPIALFRAYNFLECSNSTQREDPSDYSIAAVNSIGECRDACVEWFERKKRILYRYGMRKNTDSSDDFFNGQECLCYAQAATHRQDNPNPQKCLVQVLPKLLDFTNTNSRYSSSSFFGRASNRWSLSQNFNYLVGSSSNTAMFLERNRNFLSTTSNFPLSTDEMLTGIDKQNNAYSKLPKTSPLNTTIGTSTPRPCTACIRDSHCPNGYTCIRVPSSMTSYNSFAEKQFRTLNIFPDYGCSYPEDCKKNAYNNDQCSRDILVTKFCGKLTQLNPLQLNRYSYTNFLTKTYDGWGKATVGICNQCRQDFYCADGLSCQTTDSSVNALRFCVMGSNALSIGDATRYCLPSQYTEQSIDSQVARNVGIPPTISTSNLVSNISIFSPQHKPWMLKLASRTTNRTNVGLFSANSSKLFQRYNISYSVPFRGAVCTSRIPVRSGDRNCACWTNSNNNNKCDCRESWLGDGVCDSSCNTAECEYDKNDCKSENQGKSSDTTERDVPSQNSLQCNCRSPISKSVYPSTYSSTGSESQCECTSSWLGDGTCDSACNNAACEFDRNDCATQNNPDVYSDCECTSSWIGDGTCDSSCNNPECNFDAGDCSSENSGTSSADTSTWGPSINPTLQDAIFQCNNEFNKCTGVMVYEGYLNTPSSYFLCTDWKCPVLLDSNLYTDEEMDRSFPSVYYKTSQPQASFNDISICIENSKSQTLSVTAAALPLLLSYLLIGCCCCFVLPSANKMNGAYDDFVIQQEQRRQAIADEQKDAREIAHRLATSTANDGMYNNDTTAADGSLPRSNRFVASSFNKLNPLAVDDDPTKAATAVPIAPGKPITPMQQFSVMIHEIEAWKGDVSWMCQILKAMSSLVLESMELRQKTFKLRLIQACKVKRLEYDDKWTAEVASLFGECLSCFSFLSSIGLNTNVSVEIPTRMQSINVLSRARSWSNGENKGSVELKEMS